MLVMADAAVEVSHMRVMGVLEVLVRLQGSLFVFGVARDAFGGIRGFRRLSGSMAVGAGNSAQPVKMPEGDLSPEGARLFLDL